MLICLVVLELAHPDCPLETVERWRLQRKHGETLSPEPYDRLKTWRGRPEVRDWDWLALAKQRDGWQLVSHRREFVVDDQDGERKDQVEFARV